jgi:YjjG family noncanonical pyrimidine nucleotidase
MAYETILFDLDHTLLDSDESERQAYAHTAAKAGLDDPDRHFPTYVTINRRMWKLVEAGEMQPGEVRHRRFEEFNDVVRLDADPYAMAEHFVWALGAHGDLYPGADEVLAACASRASLGLVTNGLSDVQRSRLSRLGIGDYFDVIVISSEVGVTKPRADIFDIAFDQLGDPPRDTSVMVGDSLTSDIAGGRNAGIDTCWYNPHRNRAEPGTEPTHEVNRLPDLIDVLL